MASTAANDDRGDKEVEVAADEGIEGLTPCTGPLAERTESFLAGVRSGVSYCSGHTLPEARPNAEFVRVAASTKEREGAHGVVADGGEIASEASDAAGE